MCGETNVKGSDSCERTVYSLYCLPTVFSHKICGWDSWTRLANLDSASWSRQFAIFFPIHFFLLPRKLLNKRGTPFSFSFLIFLHFLLRFFTIKFLNNLYHTFTLPQNSPATRLSYRWLRYVLLMWFCHRFCFSLIIPPANFRAVTLDCQRGREFRYSAINLLKWFCWISISCSFRR